MAKQISGKALYAGEDFVLIKTTPLGLQTWLLGGLYVGIPDQGIVAKANLEERSYLLAVLGELTKRGIRPPDERLEYLFREFCQAVTTRGRVRWQVFFRSGTPAAAAAEYVGSQA